MDSSHLARRVIANQRQRHTQSNNHHRFSCAAIVLMSAFVLSSAWATQFAQTINHRKYSIKTHPSRRRTSAVRSSASHTLETPKSRPVISNETYEAVLEIVFPRETACDYVLRFEPTLAPESQIVIRRSRGKTEAIEYTSLSGNIYRKLDRLKAKGASEDAMEMAKAIRVRKRTVEVPLNYESLWRSNFSISNEASKKLLEERRAEEAQGIGTVPLDGTLYVIWRGQNGHDAFFRQWDHEVSDHEVTGEFQLVQWMNNIRRDVGMLLSGVRKT